MPAANQDLTAEQGATFSLLLTIKDSSNVAVDLTGNTYAGQVRKKISDEDPVATFTCTVQNQITNTGELLISLTPAETSAIPMKSQNKQERTLEEYAYDIEATYPDGSKERILEGIFSLSPEVTR